MFGRGGTSDVVVGKVIIAINVAAFLLMSALGGSASRPQGAIYENGVIFGPLVADGEWWRIVSGAFLHAGPLHLLMNMFLLWLLAKELEPAVGHLRFGLLYATSVIGGSLGVLLLSPNDLTLGASGGVFGLMGALVVLNDVTRLKALENIRRDFVANVSHELKTPITSIKGFLETLKEGAIKDPDNADHFLDIIIKHTERLDTIIEDLLSLSRIERESERGEIQLEKGQLKDVIETVGRTCLRAARKKNIHLECNVEDDLFTKFNSTMLEQALVNLVDNAIKYSEPENKVQLEAKQVGKEHVITGRDGGGGIAKEPLSRIWERCYGVDRGRSRKEGGTGLGLSIVKHIVNSHRGRIHVESSPGSGSAFSIYLPVDS
jgi:two-component system phosphate regulon sensor histidine kinase PhoR